MKVHYHHFLWAALLTKAHFIVSSDDLDVSSLKARMVGPRDGLLHKPIPHQDFLDRDKSRFHYNDLSIDDHDDPKTVDVYSLSKELEGGDPSLVHFAHANGTVSRELSPSSAKIGDFLPLACNSELDKASCTNLSESPDFPVGDEPLVIPCGVCYKYDLGQGDVTFAGGIRVIGKLRFPANLRNAVITTTSVFIEGKLTMRSNADTVGAPGDKSVVFKLTGKKNVKFKATGENVDACPGKNKECTFAPKPFVVAGGQLDIDVIPSDDCSPHTPILDKVYTDITPDDTLFDKYVPFLPSCTSNVSESSFINYDFNDGNYGNWTGWWGGYVQIENNNALRVTNREIKEQGPYLDFTRTKPGLCLIPGQEYLLSVRIKLDRADGTLDGLPTTCKNTTDSAFCPKFGTKIRMLDGRHLSNTKARLYNYRAPNYGEWYDWTDVVVWNEDELDPTNPYSVLYFDNVDPGVDISLDKFRISLPTKNAYPDPDDVCGELIINGDAEADEMNPFPMTVVSRYTPVFVKSEDGNNFFKLPNRANSGSSIQSQIHVECLQQGVTYMASAKVRIRSEFDQEFFFYLSYLKAGTENDWGSYTYLQCPPQRYSDGWVTCSGEFTVNDAIANSERVRARFYFSGSRDVDVDVDYDDVSIKYQRGKVEKLVVAADDAQCWGDGAEIHIGTSAFYSYSTWVPNGFNTVINGISSNDDGNLEITLGDAPFIPIVTVAEDEDFAADVALLSRNVEIESDTDEVDKGAYGMVLHTLNVAQVIRGVEFRNMGRKGEIDRYPMQLLYSGSIEGTTIHWSSIRGSNMRCISIEGTGNVTVSQNVAHNNKGHCIYVGHESQDNTIEQNFVSDTSSSSRIDLERDDRPAAFRNSYNPNNYINNIAVATRYYGYQFDNSDVTYYENLSSGPPNPRLIAIGEFSSNKAKSNGDSGIRFVYLLQSELVTISQALSIKHRYWGVYLYSGARISFEDCLFAENGYNMDLRWADEVYLTDTDIRGISPATKHLVHPPHFRKPCITSGYTAPVGYRMQTAISKWDGFYPDGTTPRLNKGAKFSNVEFSHFDHTDECSDSVPISFNYNDMRDGHWDYTSTFTNVRVNGTRIMDAKDASENGVSDIVISDPDGSSNPNGQASGAGTFMSNKRYLMGFAGGECKLYYDGIAYCQDTCYRTVQLRVGQSGTGDYDLRVTSDEGIEHYIPSTMRYEDDVNRTTYEGNFRRFSASLPSGKYKLEFLHNGEAVWPKYAYEVWEAAPECDGYVSSVDVSVVEPMLDSGDCDELTENSDMELGVEGWLHSNDQTPERGYLKGLSGAGVDGSKAIGYFDRYRSDHGIGQNLDTRCFHQNLNAFYEVKAWFRIENSGVPFQCDRYATSYPNRCPKLVLKNVYYVDPETKEELEWDWDTLSLTHSVATSNDESEFNLLHGVIKIGDKYNSIHRAWVYARDLNSPLDLIMDDFSVSKLDMACGGNYVRNGQLETGDSRFWVPFGTAKQEVVQMGGISVLKVFGRGNADHGIRQDLYVDLNCLNEKDRIQIRVRYQIQNPQGDPVICDRNAESGTKECAYMRLRSLSDDGDEYPYIAQTVPAHADVESAEWALLSGIHTLTSNNANHSTFWTMIAGPHQQNTIVIDSVSIEPLPKKCDQILVNPSFADGTSSSWSVSNKAIDISINSPGADDDYSLYFEHPANNKHYLHQTLDTRCMVEGQDFVLSAKFKLLDAGNGQAVGCDPDSRKTSDEQHCPFMRLRGIGCDNEFYTIHWNQKQAGWNVDEFNDYEHDIPVTANIASCSSVRVEVGWFLPITRALLIDDVNFSQKTTFAPTVSPTYSPTKAKTIGPTLSPTIKTDAPTTSLIVSCPPVGDEAVNLGAGSVIVGIAEAGSVCSVIKVVTNGDRITNLPLARSYDLNGWEVSSGRIASATFSEEFLCYTKGCQITLPPLEAGAEYHLISSAYSLSLRDEYARFLETASFGATTEDLDNLEALTGDGEPMSVIIDFVESQMKTPMTSHRKFWRTRLNPRYPFPTRGGKPDHPCNAMSRWRKFTFARADYAIPRILNIVGDGDVGPYKLYLDGHLQTVVDDFWLEKDESYSFDPDFDYLICPMAGRDLTGGDLYIQIENEECVRAENPLVDITGYEEGARYLDLSDSVLEIIDEVFSNGEEFVLPAGLDDSVCDTIPLIPDLGDPPVFGRLKDGSWLKFDPRVELEANIPSSPLMDGGKATELASGGSTLCSNVQRTFLNEDECVLSSDACRPAVSTEIDILLEDETIKTLYNLTDRYVYGLKGLHVVDQDDGESDFAWKLPHPCTKSMRSRWMRKDVNECDPTDIFPKTHKSLAELLSDESDTNPYLRDIYFPESGMKCNSTDTDPEIEILFDDQCWMRVHDDYWSVYDMTYWVDRHVGGPFHIKKWAEDGSAFLVFPNGHPVNNHPMYRWHDNSHKFTYIGRYGDNVRLRDLPSDLRTKAVTDYFQDSDNVKTSGVLVCGSPGEVQNDKTLGFAFDYQNENDSLTGYWSPFRDKNTVWVMASLNAQDQLRQRVAWALTQILVVVKDAIREETHTESFIQYTDIFLRNAFGNYRNILKEISYAPLMAENLSYRMSRSSAYVWERYRIKAQADENFAREIMQLFSMGIIQLNLDGSPRLDENGNTILAYTNDDIMSFSRAWTGFDRQPSRGNIEGFANRIDPMKIESAWRDKFPKTDTEGGYIGDMYPLCEDLPDKAFLKQGATYRFLGSSISPELMTDPFEFESDESLLRMVLDSSSALREELCNVDDSNNCQFANTVILSSSKSCSGMECLVETVRVVQVSPDAFYEYVRSPCVNQAFYNDAKKISPSYRGSNIMCGNPVLPEASEACCSFGSVDASRNARYDGERMTFATAEDRCAEVALDICDFYRVLGDRHKTSNHFWTSVKCQIHLKIKSDGLVTIIHQPFDSSDRVSHLEDENENWFKVYWKNGNYPHPRNDCDGLCEVMNGNSCLCSTSVSKGRGFGAPPQSVEEMLDKLFIGFPDPNIVDSESYSSTYDVSSGITTHLKNDVFDSKTVFEFSDDKGRHFFIKNSVETVQVRGLKGGFTGYSFRNAPQFMSFVPSEATVRDAQFETEATLDHYFYHDNTAPFLSLRLIQRLVMSNPSPRYIKAVASAFKTGLYEKGGKSFGQGSYGDMAATFAAIYLDREARTVALDGDPSTGSLREPILKVMSVLRSMKFASTYPVVRLGDVKGAIGQMPHEFETVFSFFLPEFEPYGRVGDASLVSPEGTVLDMPRITGILNGLFSLVRYGLTSQESGFGQERVNDRLYLPSPHGSLEYNRTSSAVEFSFETFEGPSLVGGFDNIWSGRHYGDFLGSTTVDPKDPSNHVYHTVPYGRGGFYSQPVTLLQNTVVKFQYLATEAFAGGCIGYSDDELDDGNWVFCDYSRLNPPHVMHSDNEWISCQFDVPVDQFRIVLGRRRTTIAEAYFDNIQIGQGSGTFCDSNETPVDIEDKAPTGRLGYSGVVVDELATLLTAGRLSTEHRLLIRDAYDNAGSSNDGLRIAQEMIFTSSEFHATNPINSGDQLRDNYSFPPPTGKPYKALVYVMLAGGCDSYNMLVPYSCPRSKDLYEEYFDIRAQVAIPKSDLFPITTDNQFCTKYGIHPDLEAIKSLYDDKNLLFFANTGVMSQPVDRSNYNLLTNTQLFAHNTMQRETKRVDPYEAATGTGVFGRMGDALSKRGHNVGSFSVNTFSVAVVGDASITGSPTIVNDRGIPPIYLGDVEDTVYSLHNTTPPDSGFFGEMWSTALVNSLDVNKLLSIELEDIVTDTIFPDTSLGRQLETVARILQTREARGVDRDTFYVQIGGFDTHADVEELLSERFIEVNAAIDAFVTELDHLELFDKVTTIQTSDFARTLSPNSGDGTDHAWGGNYMMFGGAVKGGQIAGKYPDDLTDESPTNVGRGRMIPTTPWDAVFSTIAAWLGVPNGSLDDVCPNLGNFDDSFLLDPNDLFHDIPFSSPTVSPVTSSPTKSPSDQPSQATQSPAPSAGPSDQPSWTPSIVTSESPSTSPSGSGSLSPSPSTSPSGSGSSFCSDDENFSFEGDSSKSCDWVSGNVLARCPKKDKISGFYVFEKCQNTCDRCICQNDDFYYEIPSQTCEDWVKLKKKSRCALDPSIEENCKEICGQPCCKDDPDFRHKGKESNNCGWIKKKKKKRCKLSKVSYYCPVTCASLLVSGGCHL